ncbi:anti-sigma factor [Microbacterium sp. W4I20]|uniref:anti-sigma factor n=1 Tax=Microbacterium sp. W4I20 TaxID=3042262 RepID=UPI002784E5E7|nr:anti-sigma factor [Microbacterium sp. W4I20]MDQ0728632.1 anti-sigma-K factor RskA [Microbacterium sp. W4I20]
MNEQDFAELAAGAALHALSPDDERRFREALDARPEWRAIAEADAETADFLAGGAALVTPPAGIRSALLAQIAVTPQNGDAQSSGHDDGSSAATETYAEASADDAEVPKPPTPARRRWTRTIFALAACLAVLVGVGIAAAALNGQLNRPESVIALEQIQAADDAERATVELPDGGTATAHWSASAGAAVLVTDGIPAPADGKDYELWYVRGDDAIPAGVFDVEDGRATAALDGDMQAGDVIAVTVEQAGGSPTGTPTTDPVIVIPTA